MQGQLFLPRLLHKFKRYYLPMISIAHPSVFGAASSGPLLLLFFYLALELILVTVKKKSYI